MRVAVSNGVRVVYLTGRPEKTRYSTICWLENHNLDFHDMLLMRENSDRTPARYFKSKLIKKLIAKHRYHFVLGVTDRECDIEAYEEHHIPALYARAYEE